MFSIFYRLFIPNIYIWIDCMYLHSLLVTIFWYIRFYSSLTLKFEKSNVLSRFIVSENIKPYLVSRKLPLIRFNQQILLETLIHTFFTRLISSQHLSGKILLKSSFCWHKLIELYVNIFHYPIKYNLIPTPIISYFLELNKITSASNAI